MRNMFPNIYNVQTRRFPTQLDSLRAFLRSVTHSTSQSSSVQSKSRLVQNTTTGKINCSLDTVRIDNLNCELTPLGAHLVQDSESALATAHGIARLDHITGTTVTATVFHSTGYGNCCAACRHTGGAHGGSCWIRHFYLLGW